MGKSPGKNRKRGIIQIVLYLHRDTRKRSTNVKCDDSNENNSRFVTNMRRKPLLEGNPLLEGKSLLSVTSFLTNQIRMKIANLQYNSRMYSDQHNSMDTITSDNIMPSSRVTLLRFVSTKHQIISCPPQEWLSSGFSFQLINSEKALPDFHVSRRSMVRW